MLNKYVSIESTENEGFQGRQETPRFGPIGYWSSEPEGSTEVLDQWVQAKSKLAGMSQSFVRHLSKVQLLVISGGSNLVVKELSSEPKPTQVQFLVLPFSTFGT